MEINEILAAFERSANRFPTKAVQAAVAQREAITPELLRILEDTIENAESILENDPDGDYCAHLFALMLLAQFRETRAYPLVIQLARMDFACLDELVGDMLLEDIPQVLASVCGGDAAPIKALIEDSLLNEWVRSTALDALRVLIVEGVIPVEEATCYLRELFDYRLERKASYVWASWSSLVEDIRAVELVDQVRAAYQLGMIEADFSPLSDFEKEIARPGGDELKRVRQRHWTYVDDTAASLSRWDCFKPRETPTVLDMFTASEFSDAWRAEPKIGPNERCPCGSGKKYKKCCGDVRLQ